MNGAEPRIGLAPEAYLAERVDEQLAWYDRKSVSHKRWYYGLQLLTLVSAAMVPIISLASGELAVRIVVAISGSIAAIAAGAASLYRFREQWLDYRVAAETIKYERYRYVTGVEPYAGTDAFSRFVNRVESIILEENRVWRQRDFGAGGDGKGEEGAADGRSARGGTREPADDADADAWPSAAEPSSPSSPSSPSGPSGPSGPGVVHGAAAGADPAPAVGAESSDGTSPSEGRRTPSRALAGVEP